MKLAFVHCWVAPGGALSVLHHLIHEEIEKRSFDTEKDKFIIFTLYSEFNHLEVDGIQIPIVTALPIWLNTFFLRNSKGRRCCLKWLFDYRNLMLFYPLLMKVLSHKVKHFWPKKVIISSFAVAKNLDFCHKSIQRRDDLPYTSLYLHSPMQYIWSHHQEYLHKLHGIKGWIFKLITPLLRKRDLGYTVFDEVSANSEYTTQLAQRLYGIQAEVHYPQINPAFFNSEIVIEPKPYFVMIGRLVRFVRECDTIIKLFNHLGIPLFVLGSGPDETYLRKIAKENIHFLGHIHDTQERIEIQKHARGLINLTKESFGLGTAESLLLGVPVFGLDDGATPELVSETSGTLVSSKDIHHLLEQFKRFSTSKRDRQTIAQQARQHFE